VVEKSNLVKYFMNGRMFWKIYKFTALEKFYTDFTRCSCETSETIIYRPHVLSILL